MKASLNVVSSPAPDHPAAAIFSALRARGCRPRYFARRPFAVGFRGPACVAVALVAAGPWRVELVGRGWWLARLSGRVTRTRRSLRRAIRDAAQAIAEAGRGGRGRISGALSRPPTRHLHAKRSKLLEGG